MHKGPARLKLVPGITKIFSFTPLEQQDHSCTEIIMRQDKKLWKSKVNKTQFLQHIVGNRRGLSMLWIVTFFENTKKYLRDIAWLSFGEDTVLDLAGIYSNLGHYSGKSCKAELDFERT